MSGLDTAPVASALRRNSSKAFRYRCDSPALTCELSEDGLLLPSSVIFVAWLMKDPVKDRTCVRFSLTVAAVSVPLQSRSGR